MDLKYNLALPWLLRDRSPLPITTLEVIKDSPEFVTSASSEHLQRSIFSIPPLPPPISDAFKGHVMFRHKSLIQCGFIVKRHLTGAVSFLCGHLQWMIYRLYLLQQSAHSFIRAQSQNPSTTTRPASFFGVGLMWQNKSTLASGFFFFLVAPLL